MSDSALNEPPAAYRIDRTKVRVVPFGAESEFQDWADTSPQERLSAVEFLRSQYYGTETGTTDP